MEANVVPDDDGTAFPARAEKCHKTLAGPNEH